MRKNKYPRDGSNTATVELSKATRLCYTYDADYNLTSCSLQGDYKFGLFTIVELAALRRELLGKTFLENK